MAYTYMAHTSILLLTSLSIAGGTVSSWIEEIYGLNLVNSVYKCKRETAAYRNQEHDQHDEVKQNESKQNP